MTTLEEAFNGKNSDYIASMIANGITDYQKKKQQEEEKITKNKKQQVVKQKRNDGTIAPRPGYSNNVDIGKLVFSLSNHTIGDAWCLPSNRRRVDDIMRNSKYTYLDAVIASVISCALEGDMTAARLALSLMCSYS